MTNASRVPETSQSASGIPSSFWEAAARERLVYPRCRACRRAFFPPAPVCPSCLSRKVAWEESAGQGALYSWTVVHRAPTADVEVPYVIAVVDLDEGFDLMTNLVGADPAALRADERVEVMWRERDGRREPVFRLLEESA